MKRRIPRLRLVFFDMLIFFWGGEQFYFSLTIELNQLNSLFIQPERVYIMLNFDN